MQRVSIAICTYNRAAELATTLDSLLLLELTGAPDFELLVVDNNSTDQTPRVVTSYEARFQGRLRSLVCPEQGLSHARNCAVAAAKFEIVAMLDDDVCVDPEWLRAISRAHESGAYAAVGGRSYLIFPSSRPGWLSERHEGYLSKVDHGAVAQPASPEELFGLNLTFRKDWLDRVGTFRTDLGREGKNLLGGEETELLERLVKAGGRLLYEPAAVVGHRVAPERLRRRWFLARGYWGGRGLARSNGVDKRQIYSVVRSAWHLTLFSARAARDLLRYGPSSPEGFDATKQVAVAAGVTVELLRQGLRFRRPRTTGNAS